MSLSFANFSQFKAYERIRDAAIWKKRSVEGTGSTEPIKTVADINALSDPELNDLLQRREAIEYYDRDNRGAERDERVLEGIATSITEKLATVHHIKISTEDLERILDAKQ